jgi:hypothetical protein
MSKMKKGISAQSYYKSNSAGVWRCMPDYYVKTTHGGEEYIQIGKGYSGEESCNLPFITQRALDEIGNQRVIDIGRKSSDFALVGLAYDRDRIRPQPQLQQPDFALEINHEPDYQFIEADSQRRHKTRLEDLVIPADKAPDFSKRMMGWESNNEMYGLVTTEVYGSNNNEFRYMFCHDKLGRSWIAAIEMAKEKMTSLGLSKNWADGGDITTPAFEYGEQSGGFGNPELGYDDNLYIDMYKNYISRIPIIKQYEETFGRGN